LKSIASTRLAGLDTLRSIAIVSVIIFHLQYTMPNSLQDSFGRLGWTGVDLFFVLSGFLIGSLLLKPGATGKKLKIGEFYLRRAYRILPAYLVVVALYLFVPVWREHPIVAPAWKLLSFTYNLTMRYPQELAFSHSWSLCIEEHFYLLLPLIILWLMRRPSARMAIALFLFVLIFGIAIRGWTLFHVVRPADDDHAWILFMKYIYYPTYTRLDGLLCGVALAAIKLFRPGIWARIERRGWTTLALGVLVLVAGFWTFRFGYPSSDDAPGILLGFPVVSMGFALLVASAVASNGPLRLRMPGAEAVATLAFSLYLTHKGVAHVAQRMIPWLQDNAGWSAAGVTLLACVAFAALLYFVVERSFLALRDRHLRPRVAETVDLEARVDPAI
jgi:peptidoglycan/LPS O-acetylase OafA/YrhL